MSTNRELERLSLVGLVLTGLGLLTTIFNVVNSNSLVIVADLCSSLLEFASDLIAFGAFLLMRSRRVALLEYGLGKIESITSLLVSIMMIFSVLILLGMAVPRITHPVAITGFGIWLGLLCAAVFGVLIVLMGCYHGFHSKGGAQGVGAATTAAVVSSSILILAANYLLTSILFHT